MIFKSDSTPGELNGFLDAGSHLRGELEFKNTFRVDGELTGKVVSSGDLVIGDDGVVNGEIEVGRLYVSGTVKGHVRANERIEIGAKGRVEADISTPALVIEDGAFFQGTCSMDRPKAVAARPVPIEQGSKKSVGKGESSAS